jgi:hypothetical protein
MAPAGGTVEQDRVVVGVDDMVLLREARLRAAAVPLSAA